MTTAERQWGVWRYSVFSFAFWFVPVGSSAIVRLPKPTGFSDSKLLIKEDSTMPLAIEIEQEDDGRWLAEVPDLPGVLTYGNTRKEAIDRVRALSLRVLADRLDHGEPIPEMSGVFAVTP